MFGLATILPKLRIAGSSMLGSIVWAELVSCFRSFGLRRCHARAMISPSPLRFPIYILDFKMRLRVFVLTAGFLLMA
jgi:hypothetical protein